MKIRLAAVTALLLLALTGCAGNADSSGDEPTAPATAESPTAAPATVDPANSEEVDAEKYFLDSGLVSQIELSDEAKLAAGYYACEQVEAQNFEVVAIEGIEEGLNRGFVTDATVVLCPELADSFREYKSAQNDESVN